MRPLAAVLGLLAALTILGVACSEPTQVTLASPEQTGISVSGTGKVTVVPDIGMLYLGVEVSQPTVAAARDGAGKAMEAMRASLKQNGVEDKDIATQGFSIQPRYDFSDGKPTGTPQISGYTASNQVSVKVRQMDSLTKVLDGAVAAGGNDVRVNNISFVVDDPETHLDRAREEAVADARDRAETLATAAGVKLGKVRAVIEGGTSPLSYPPGMIVPPATGGKGGDTPVSPGETELSVFVTVTFDVE